MSTALKVVETQTNDAETLKRLERYIGSPPENSRIFTITPYIAAAILETRNENNRPRSSGEVKKLAAHMAAGNWKMTGDTLKFSVSGRLLDGQHRLTACVQSGGAFRTHVIFGIDDDAFDFLDAGKKRTPAHVLSIAGYPNAGRLAAATRWAYLVDTGRVKNRDTLEANRILSLVRERYPTLTEFVPIGQAVSRVNPLVPDAIISALIYHFHRKNPEKATAFSDGWISGAWGGKFKVFEKLSRKLRELHEASSGRVNDVVRAALIVRAWNAFVEGRVGTARDFEWVLTTDEFPEIKD